MCIPHGISSSISTALDISTSRNTLPMLISGDRNKLLFSKLQSQNRKPCCSPAPLAAASIPGNLSCLSTTERACRARRARSSYRGLSDQKIADSRHDSCLAVHACNLTRSGVISQANKGHELPDAGAQAFHTQIMADKRPFLMGSRPR